MTEHSPQKPGPPAFHRARSECLDAFVTAEEAIITLLVRSGTKFKGESTGQKIAKLLKAKVGPNFTEESKTNTAPILQRFLELQDVRNDLVHSRLQVIELSDQTKAWLINARQYCDDSQTVRLMPLSSFHDITREVTKIADDLRKV